MSTQDDCSLIRSAETEAEYEHLFVECFRPCLERLQFAVALAQSQDVPLATACYRDNLANTIDELARWFEREAAAHYRQKSQIRQPQTEPQIKSEASD